MRRSTAFSASPLEHYGSRAVADAQDHGVVVLGLEADRPVLRREKYIHSRAAYVEFVSFPMTHDSDSKRVRFGDQIIESSTRDPPGAIRPRQFLRFTGPFDFASGQAAEAPLFHDGAGGLSLRTHFVSQIRPGSLASLGWTAEAAVPTCSVFRRHPRLAH
jgi:hypothetical protein